MSFRKVGIFALVVIRQASAQSCQLCTDDPFGDLAARGITCDMMMASIGNVNGDDPSGCEYFDGKEIGDRVFSLGLVPNPPAGTSIKQLCPMSCADRRKGAFCPVLPENDLRQPQGCDATDSKVERVVAGNTQTITWELDTRLTFEVGVPVPPMPDPNVAHADISGRTKMLSQTTGWGFEELVTGGAVKLYHQKSDGSWEGSAELAPEETIDSFGRAIQLEGDVALIGAPYHNAFEGHNQGAGSVFVYERNGDLGDDFRAAQHLYATDR
jgi:hypothetical protein